MNDINIVSIIGRLTRDAELKYTQGGTAISRFSIACNTTRKDGDKYVEQAHFFDCVLWGKMAESLNQYLLKGKQVGILGELRQNRWTTQEGQARSRIEIHVNNIQLLGGDKGGQVNFEEKPAGVPIGEAPEYFNDDIPF